MENNVIYNWIQKKINNILDKDKFPNYEKLPFNTVEEVLCGLITVHMRYWYLEDAMSKEENCEELKKYRRWAETMYQQERPSLIESLDKVIMQIINHENHGFSYSELYQTIDDWIQSTYLNNLDRLAVYDDVYSDTFSELIDRLIIVEIRNWYLINEIDNLTKEHKDTKLLKNKLKILHEKKRPMLINSLNKMMVKIAKGEVEYTDSNIKLYDNQTSKKNRVV